jgi:hypothetical protein
MRRIPVFSFSYSVTRQYPYKWFTPTAIAGGIILTILFSAINFFSNAYNMVAITTDNPYLTESKRWSGRVPGIFTSKIQPKCEDAIIPLGSSIHTNQSAFSYQLNSVTDYASLAYRYQWIESCGFERIVIDFTTNNGRQADSIDRSAWSVAVSADLQCIIPTPTFHDDLVNVDLGVRYEALRWSDEPGVSSISFEPENPALIWAETLLLGFWAETVSAITDQTAQPMGTYDSSSSGFNLSSGYVIFQIDPVSGMFIWGPDGNADIRNVSFFTAGQYAFFDNDLNGHRGNWSCGLVNCLDTVIADASWPDVLAPVNRLAKAMFSAVNADLNQYFVWDGGQTFQSFSTSMITTSENLDYWTANLTDIWNASTLSDKDSLLVDPNDAKAQLRMAQYNGTSTVAFAPTIISTTYICQVPQLKSGFNIFISILVADLVLLRVAWTLYNFVVCYFLKDRHTDSNICLGCLERGQNDDTGTEERVSIDAGEDNSLHGEVIELDDYGSNLEEQADGQSSQNLLTRKPVGG